MTISLSVDGTTTSLTLLDDAWVRSTPKKSDQNYGNLGGLVLKDGGNDKRISFLKFELPSSLGAVVSATLTLIIKDMQATSGNITVKEVFQETWEPGDAFVSIWDEDTVTWNSQPFIYQAYELDRVSFDSSTTSISLDVTSFVQGAQGISMPNVSFAVEGVGIGSNNVRFRSKEALNGLYMPQLNVTV